MSQAQIVQGVFDEAGDTGHGIRSSRYLVVAVIVCNNMEPLRRVVARTRKTLGKELRQMPERDGLRDGGVAARGESARRVSIEPENAKFSSAFFVF